MERNKRILLHGQSSNSQPSAPPTNSEADQSMAEPSSDQPEEDSSEPKDSSSDNDNTDSSSEESPNPNESEVLKECRRRLAIYTEMLNNSIEKQVEEKAESVRKRKAGDPSNEILSIQMELQHSHDIIKKCFEKGMEVANVQGYIYGIVLEDNTVLSGSSPSLRKWWEETVRFEQSGPAAANQFYSVNQLNFDLTDDAEPQRRTYDILMQLCDATLASILSAVMQCCDPPQRKFPFENKVPPHWWPTGHEPWWEETSVEREQGPPPYKKPHDLKKNWKAVVVISITKYMAPNFGKLAHVVRQSKNLQDRMTAREMNAWNCALKEEMKIYSRDHPDVPLSDLVRPFQAHRPLLPGESSSSVAVHEAMGLQRQPQLQTPEQQQQQQQQQQQAIPMAVPPREQRMLPGAPMGRFSWPTQRRTLRFTCGNPRCLHHDNDFGFQTAALRDYHQQFCGFRNTAGLFAAPIDLPSPFTPMIQPPSGLMVPPPPVPPLFPPQIVQTPSPSMLSPQRTPLQEMFRSTSEMGPPQQSWPFNAGVPNYPDMGQMLPSFNAGGFYTGEGSNSGNPGSYMQLLNEMHSNTVPMSLQQQQQQLHGTGLMHQDLMESYNHFGGGAGPSTGVFQPTRYQPFVPTEMQLLPNEPAAEQRLTATPTNVALPQGFQSSMLQPSFTIPQASNAQQSASHEGQSGVVPNQSHTGNNETWHGGPFHH